MQHRVLLYTYEEQHYFKAREARHRTVGILGKKRGIYYVDIFSYDNSTMVIWVSVPEKRAGIFGV